VSVVVQSVTGLPDPQTDARTQDMIRIPGGTFRMGPGWHRPEAAPIHRTTFGGTTSHIGFPISIRERNTS
jgi:hypothetical protein